MTKNPTHRKRQRFIQFTRPEHADLGPEERAIWHQYDHHGAEVDAELRDEALYHAEIAVREFFSLEVL